MIINFVCPVLQNKKKRSTALYDSKKFTQLNGYYLPISRLSLH